MRGSSAARRPAGLPLFHYPYAEWRDSLQALAAAEPPDPYLGHALEFTNPADGGPVMPVIAAHVRLLPAGFETLPRRTTEGAVFAVVGGHGHATIGGQQFTLSEGDIVVVPSWNELRLRADTALTLFGYSDRAAQEKLGLYREHRA